MEERDTMTLTRAFVCITMPDAVVKEVARVQGLLGKRKFVGKMTELANLHLTLKFLGEIDENMIAKAKDALSKIHLKGFEAKIGELGTFGFRGMPRIVWCKVGGKGVFELQQHVDEALAGLEFAKEARFMSHLTLARIKYVEDARGFIEHARGLKMQETRWNVDAFYLMKSELKAGGPVYTMLAAFHLGNEI